MAHLVKLMIKLFNMQDPEDGPRADMFLPDWLLLFGIVLVLGGIIAGIALFGTLGYASLLILVGASVLGVLAVMCWKNQSVRVLSDTEFEYTTFLGNKNVYRFDEINGLKQNSDSMTLFVGDGKVHIESCAIITERFANLVNEALERLE